MIRLLSGKQLVMIHGFTYHRTGAEFITLITGVTLLLINKYSYHKIGAAKYCGGFRWRCSSKKRCKCKAFAVLSDDDALVLRIVGPHNHDPPIYKHTKFITLPNGKRLLMVNGYTFHKGGGHIRCYGGVKWRCSASKKRCNAFVAVSDCEEYIIKYKLNHVDHDPPVYKVDRNGVLVRRSNNGLGMVYRRFMYYPHYKIKKGFRWRCCRYHLGCKAAFQADVNHQILRSQPNHNHSPPELEITNGICHKKNYNSCRPVW
ncbi:jg8416 [Pararge aegeria aegeria]|uniref:Jg8416 protein n=1 Tax=Pararge aegeria aegeria TaxID=348720 RepID=A0A8S4SI47_9NEOP|nr:jg8416 [Pararge aegeria aegeria]